jgi:DNA-binding transcriptional LysR family regulator
MTFTHSFSAAAAELGYSQSAVSRQIAALERETGATLFERHRAGVRLTENGLILLRHARVVLDEIAAAERELTGAEPDVHDVRVDAFISAGAVVLPRALRALRNQRPDIRVTTREGTTPALVRALRAGPSMGGESLMGVWPGLAGRPRVAHTARDWMRKLQLVAAGCGMTTVPPNLVEVLPDGVQLLRVDGGPDERRRALVARMPGRPSRAVVAVIDALRGGYPS